MARKIWVWALAGLAVTGAAAGGVLYARGQAEYATIAVGYAAKQTCSCLHVSGRTTASCMDDFPADARQMLTITPAGDAVSASAGFGLFQAQAVYEEGLGCRLVR